MTQHFNSRERQKQIIQATLNIIAKKGISGLTTAEIARSVGIAEATIFRHYVSKKEILQATLLYIRNTLLERGKTVAAEPINPMEKLGQLLKFQLNFFQENSGVPKIIFSEQVHLLDESLRQIMCKTIQDFTVILETIIRDGVIKGQFKADTNVKMVAATYLGLIQVNVLKWSLQNCPPSLVDQFQPIFNFLTQILRM